MITAKDFIAPQTRKPSPMGNSVGARRNIALVKYWGKKKTSFQLIHQSV
jgi:mevalonate pyrophosphate decarboxylase